MSGRLTLVVNGGSEPSGGRCLGFDADWVYRHPVSPGTGLEHTRDGKVGGVDFDHIGADLRTNLKEQTAI
ncbi:MAG: hypothetical protein AAFY56_05300 [Pseudomonadota bacterium]